jgi:integrase
MGYRLKPGTNTITAISIVDGRQREISTGIKVPSHIKFTPPSSFTGGTHQEIMELTRQIVNFDMGISSQSSQNTLGIWADEYMKMVEAGEIRSKSGARLAYRTVLSIRSKIKIIKQFIQERGDLDFNMYGHTGEMSLGKRAVVDKYASYSAALQDYMSRYSIGTQTNVIIQIDAIIKKMSYVNDIVVKDEYMKFITRYPKRVAHEPISLDSEQIEFILNRKSMMKYCKTRKQKELVGWMIIGLVTGARYSDICSWTPDNIVDVKGQLFLHYTPQKTSNSSQRVVRLPLPPIALQVLNLSHPSYKLMPYQSKAIARSVRELMKLYPIFDRDVVIVKKGQPVTRKLYDVFKFHWLRSSSATYMVSRGIPQDMVRNILGHSMSSKSFDVYATVLDKEKAKAVMSAWRVDMN